MNGKIAPFGFILADARWRGGNRLTYARGDQAKYGKDAVPEMWLALDPNGRTAT
ncbi:MAG: hypothetical protein P4M05_01110 [Bradyrhizobium sp.]|nr:hypothetical protein [Bradyrhizobium sp.]